MPGTFEELREQARLKKTGLPLKVKPNLKAPALSQVETPKIEHQKTTSMFDGSHVKVKEQEVDGCFIIIPDVHSYVRDVQAYEVTMESIKIIADNYPVKKFVQLGDLMECGEMSTHPPSHVNEMVPNYVEEVDWAVNDFWARAMKYCPKGTEFHALLGNHEHRVNKKLLEKLGRGDTTRQLYNHLMPTEIYKNMGINVVAYANEDEKDGMLRLHPELICVHGWNFAENCASAHLRKLRNSSSVIFGHVHRIQSHVVRKPGTNELVGAWTMGALAKTNLFYNNGNPTDHALGFGLVFTHGNTFSVHTLPILGNNHKEVKLPNGSVLST